MEPHTIAIEDLATVFVSQFIKDHKRLFVSDSDFRNKILRMNYSTRRKLVEQTLTNLEKDLASMQ